MLVNLIRTESSAQGTLGMLLVNDMRFYTIELPWKENQRSKSCIPYGEYACELINSPHFGEVYQIKDVPGRTHILMHPGNWAGDTEQGYRTDSDGCVLLGEAPGNIANQLCVTSSKKALNHFMYITAGAPFSLIISGMFYDEDLTLSKR